MSKLKKGTEFDYRKSPYVVQKYNSDGSMVATNKYAPWQVFRFTAEQQKLIKVVVS